MKLIYLFLFSLLFIGLGSAAVNIGTTPDDIEGVVILQATPSTGVGVGNVTTFLNLSDTPFSYSGEANNCVKVNVGETGLVFGACAAGGGDTQKNASDHYLSNDTSTIFFSEANLNVTIAYEGNRLGFNQSGGGGGNPFDQVLNTTSDVEFNSTNITQDLYVNRFVTTGSGAFFWNAYDDGSEAFLNFTSVTDAVNIEVENSKLVLFNEPKQANDWKVLQTFSKEAQDTTEFVVTKAGKHHASYFVRSLAVAGNSTSTPTPFNCSTYADKIDCRTDFSGADLYVVDDIEADGDIFADGSFVGSGANLTNVPTFNDTYVTNSTSGWNVSFTEIEVEKNITILNEGGIIFKNGILADLILLPALPLSDTIVTIPNIAGTLMSLAGSQTVTGEKIFDANTTFNNNITVGENAFIPNAKFYVDSNDTEITLTSTAENITPLFLEDGTGVKGIIYTVDGLNIDVHTGTTEWNIQIKDCNNNTVKEKTFKGIPLGAGGNSAYSFHLEYVNDTMEGAIGCWSTRVEEISGVGQFRTRTAKLEKIMA